MKERIPFNVLDISNPKDKEAPELLYQEATEAIQNGNEIAPYVDRQSGRDWWKVCETQADIKELFTKLGRPPL